MSTEVVSIAKTREMTTLGTTKIYELIAANVLRTSKVGRRRLVHVDSIRQLVGAE